MKALIFDCDGVLVDTERDGHRVAFNQAFAAAGLAVHWSVERYGELLSTAGGKERMRRHFGETGWPCPPAEQDALITGLHGHKTDLFMQLIKDRELPLRSGVARIVDEAIAAGMQLAVCSTSSQRAVQSVVDVLLGAERSAHIPVFAGDIVPAKKPDPAIYNLAAQRLKLDPAQCVVIEDSNNGLHAALGAGMRCVVTKSSFTKNEDFSGAHRIVDELGDGQNALVDLAYCKRLCTIKVSTAG